MLMDNIEGGITLKNTSVPRRPKLTPLKPSSGSLKPLPDLIVKTSNRTVSPLNTTTTNDFDTNGLNNTAASVGLDINDFNSSIDSDGEGSPKHNIKFSTFDDDSISSKESQSMT
jgi:hypothetical protein